MTYVIPESSAPEGVLLYTHFTQVKALDWLVKMKKTSLRV